MKSYRLRKFFVVAIWSIPPFCITSGYELYCV